MSNFRPYDRGQQLLLRQDLREWVPEDDLAHFVVEAVERLDIGAFKVNWRGTGKAQYHPQVMLRTPSRHPSRPPNDARR